jgi:RNA:NAD 2'-phosphotransferase (TPT1/KptA family)
VFYVPDLAKKNWSVVMPEKKDCGDRKMLLLRRRNTTSLTKFHPLTLHTSPNSSELTKHRTCEATIVKKSIYRNQYNLNFKTDELDHLPASRQFKYY